MSSRYKVHDDQLPHFITATVIKWIDALSRSEYKDIIIDSLNFCIEKKGLNVHAWVIMSNHLHLIANAKQGFKLSGIVRDFKKFTSNKLVEAIKHNPQESRKDWMIRAFAFAGKYNSSNEQYQFWQQDYHPVELNNDEMYIQRLNYLHENPVRAGIVWEASQYKYSSAIDYYENKKGLLPIEIM